MIGSVFGDELEQDGASVSTKHPGCEWVGVFDDIVDPGGHSADNVPAHPDLAEGREEPDLDDVAEFEDRIRSPLLEQVADSRERRYEIAVRLEEFADEAQYLSRLLIEAIEGTLSQRGLTSDEIEARTKQVIKAWAAA